MIQESTNQQRRGTHPKGELFLTVCLACLPKPCPEAISEVFNSKFHIIGAVGIGIAMVMVSGRWSREEDCCQATLAVLVRWMPSVFPSSY